MENGEEIGVGLTQTGVQDRKKPRQSDFLRETAEERERRAEREGLGVAGSEERGRGGLEDGGSLDDGEEKLLGVEGSALLVELIEDFGEKDRGIAPPARVV